MLRILIFLVVVFLLGLGFSWIADNPGLVTITLPAQGEAVAGKEIEVSLMVAVVAAVSLIATIMIVWSITMAIWRSPEIFSRWRKGRRKDRGYAALSRGMIAAAAGDGPSARKLTRESNKLLSNEPLVSLLDAQTALLEDKREIAQAKFEKMLEDPETRLLGLRGLYVEAERQGETKAAAHYAERAMELAPEAPWAGTALLRHQSTAGDWQGALKTLETNRWTNKKTKKQNNRLKAVLQTAQAMTLENQAPEQARTLALAAHKLAPELVPAAVIAARISGRLGDFRKATKTLEATWKIDPHPEIAEAYVHVRSGDSAADRLKRARSLAAKRQNHVEGQFAIAEAAIDAKDWDAAREALAVILRSNPTERACLLMADIEEAEHGDRGRMRDWLSRAVRAPRDPAWTADGYVSEKWAPVSPISGRLDAFEWKVPVEMLGGPDDVVDYSDFATAPLPPEEAPVAPAIAAIAAAATMIDDVSDIETVEETVKSASASTSSDSDQATTTSDVENLPNEKPTPTVDDISEKITYIENGPAKPPVDAEQVAQEVSANDNTDDGEQPKTTTPETTTIAEKPDAERETPEKSTEPAAAAKPLTTVQTDNAAGDTAIIEASKDLDDTVTSTDKPDLMPKPDGNTGPSELAKEIPIVPDDPGVSEQELNEPEVSRFKLF